MMRLDAIVLLGKLSRGLVSFVRLDKKTSKTHITDLALRLSEFALPLLHLSSVDVRFANSV